MAGKRIYDREACVTEICNRLTEGETLRSITHDKHIPHFSVVYDWMNEDESISRRIACAREVGFDAIAEDILQIADTPEITIIEEDSNGRKKVIRKDATEHRKLKIWSRLQLLSKWHPKKYGDKQAMELTEPNNPPMNSEERERRIIAIIAKAEARIKAEEGSTI